MDKRIRITFEVVTPESAEHGDAADRGWIDECGVPFDDDDDETAAEAAARFLLDRGATNASSSRYHPGVWYSDNGDHDYSDGSETTLSYHLVGFSDDEQSSIYRRVTS